MQSLQGAEEAAYRSLVRALQLDHPTWVRVTGIACSSTQLVACSCHCDSFGAPDSPLYLSTDTLVV